MRSCLIACLTLAAAALAAASRLGAMAWEPPGASAGSDDDDMAVW